MVKLQSLPLIALMIEIPGGDFLIVSELCDIFLIGFFFFFSVKVYEFCEIELGIGENERDWLH